MYYVPKSVTVRVDRGRLVSLAAGPRGKGHNGFLDEFVDLDAKLEKALGPKLAELLEDGTVEIRADA